MTFNEAKLQVCCSMTHLHTGSELLMFEKCVDMFQTSAKQKSLEMLFVI
jgi:hypothetical protein